MFALYYKELYIVKEPLTKTVLVRAGELNNSQFVKK